MTTTRRRVRAARLLSLWFRHRKRSVTLARGSWDFSPIDTGGSKRHPDRKSKTHAPIHMKQIRFSAPFPVLVLRVAVAALLVAGASQSLGARDNESSNPSGAFFATSAADGG